MGFLNGDKEDKKKKNLIPIVYAEDCSRKAHCPVVDICPVGAITQKPGEPPEVDGTLCNRCGDCLTACENYVFDFQEISLDLGDLEL